MLSHAVWTSAGPGQAAADWRCCTGPRLEKAHPCVGDAGLAAIARGSKCEHGTRHLASQPECMPQCLLDYISGWHMACAYDP